MSRMEKSLLNDFQHDFPTTERPFADIAGQMGTDEGAVLSSLARLQSEGVVSRVGAVFETARIGCSSLVAMAVPPARLDEVAGLVNTYAEVNHNYEREHRLNLWFVLTASCENRLGEVLNEIEQRTGIEPLVLPMLEAYHIDLGFNLEWK